MLNGRMEELRSMVGMCWSTGIIVRAGLFRAGILKNVALPVPVDKATFPKQSAKPVQGCQLPEAMSTTTRHFPSLPFSHTVA
jgi:hypothetical protein